MSDKDKIGTHVVLDVSPLSLRCFDMKDCSAIAALKDQMPSVDIKTNVDGTVTATCPISKYQEAQHIVNTTCFGCRHR